MLAALAVAEFLGMTLWFSATAVTPVLVDEFAHVGRRTRRGSRWRSRRALSSARWRSAVANLADVLNARVLLFLGRARRRGRQRRRAAGAPQPTAVIAPALPHRHGAGVRVSAGHEARRGLVSRSARLRARHPDRRAHARQGVSASADGALRTRMARADAAGVGLAVAGGVLVLVVVRDGPYVAATAPFDPHAIRRIFQSRGARSRRSAISATCGSSTRCGRGLPCSPRPASPRRAGRRGRAGSIAAFVAIGSGTAGCVLAGWLADRLGRARVAIWAMWTSAACAALTTSSSAHRRSGSSCWPWCGASRSSPTRRSSRRWSASTAPRDHVGTALTLQTCLGFLLTMVTIELLPRLATRSAGDGRRCCWCPGRCLESGPCEAF